MSAYVTCASCGARMKADREWCLRCEAPLVAAPAVPGQLRLPSWSRAWGGGTLIFGTVGTLVLCLAIAAFWEWRSPADDGAGRPAPASPPTTTAPAARDAAASASSASADLPEPVAFVDITRSGGLEFGKGDFAAARARYEQALEKKSDDPETLNNLGLVLERMGQIDDAIARFSRALELAPDKWTYHFNLAHAVELRKDWDRALAEYRTASRLFPDDYAVQYNLAMVLHKKGDDRAAIPEFEKAIQLAPSEASFHLSLGISLEIVGRLADAQREYQLYLANAPAAPDADKVKAHIQALAAPQPAAQPAAPAKGASVS